MSFDIRHPSITGKTETEQLQQIRSYLYQLTPQLNWALNTLETAKSNVVAMAEASRSSSISEESQKKIDNFNEIKALIIKSADVVNAFYDQIATTLVSEYKAVAKGIDSYEGIASNEISASADGIKQVFGNIQKLEGNFNELFTDEKDAVYMIKTEAYIKTGILYADESGTPVYGIEVGQVSNDDDNNPVYNGMARFTPTKLAFFDGTSENEVAYISKQQFYITRGEVTETLRIGGYILSSTPETGLSFKWFGFN